MSAALSACSTLGIDDEVTAASAERHRPISVGDPQSSRELTSNSEDDSTGTTSNSELAELYLSDNSRVGWVSRANSVEAGEFDLKFNSTPVSTVVSQVIGEMLKETYVLDASVSGTITLNTRGPVAKSELVPLLESALAGIGAVLSRENGIFRIGTPSAGTSSTVRTGRRPLQSAGYQTLVVPLRHVDANQIKSILEAVHKSDSQIFAEPGRNVIIVSGTGSQLDVYLDTINIFDVDAMAGMSVGIFPLRAVEAATIRTELEALLGVETGEGQGANIRIVEINRLNALMLISPQDSYLEQARVWIERLDRANESVTASRHHVYFVQHGSAEQLAGVLQEMFAQGRTRSQSSGARELIAPGLSSNDPASNLSTLPGTQSQSASDIRITADIENNALLISASNSDYRELRSIIQQLDVQPVQVLVQASFAEVQLRDELSYGLEWFFKNGGIDGDKNGTGRLDLGGSGISAIAPGFSYSVVDSTDSVRAVINALANDSLVSVISSPSLMVLDNRTARINIGDQVPIRTSEATSIATSGANPIITSTIQFRDTGVVLEVTPHVSNSGTIVLDIDQNVSTVAATTTSGIDSPTINQREIVTTIAVSSGDTVVLGGFISDTNSENNAGLPVIRKVPVLGALFGNKSVRADKTELIVLITPTAVFDTTTARRVTNELRNRMTLIGSGGAK